MSADRMVRPWHEGAALRYEEPGHRGPYGSRAGDSMGNTSVPSDEAGVGRRRTDVLGAMSVHIVGRTCALFNWREVIW
jgi:hypothetical protein